MDLAITLQTMTWQGVKALSVVQGQDGTTITADEIVALIPRKTSVNGGPLEITAVDMVMDIYGRDEVLLSFTEDGVMPRGSYAAYQVTRAREMADTWATICCDVRIVRHSDDDPTWEYVLCTEIWVGDTLTDKEERGALPPCGFFGWLDA